MKWRLTIAGAVLAVVAVVGGSVVALAGGSTGHPQRPITHPTRHWLRQHAYLVPGSRQVDISEVAKTLLHLEPDYRTVHDVHTYNAIFRDELVTQACRYIFGPSGRINHHLHVRGFRFDLPASGPNVSPAQPGGADHNGYALQCGYSRGLRGAQLLELGVSSGGLTLPNLTTYAQARREGATGGLFFVKRPRALAGKPQLRGYLHDRLVRVADLT